MRLLHWLIGAVDSAMPHPPQCTGCWTGQVIARCSKQAAHLEGLAAGLDGERLTQHRGHQAQKHLHRQRGHELRISNASQAAQQLLLASSMAPQAARAAQRRRTLLAVSSSPFSRRSTTSSPTAGAEAAGTFGSVSAPMVRKWWWSERAAGCEQRAAGCEPISG